MENLSWLTTNKLIKNYQGATGLKTGSTSLALFNLSASATRDGLSLIAVVMRRIRLLKIDLVALKNY